MKSDRSTILIVDDDDKILFAFREVFRKDGYRSIVARDGAAALEAFASSRPDAVFMDITMPTMGGLEALKEMKEQSPATPVVIITGFGTMQTAIRAMQLGAFEYLTKPLDVHAIRTAARRALATVTGPAVPSLESGILRAGTTDRYEIVGRSRPMLEVFKLIGSICATPSHTPVLIQGESGTGKELVARAIHANGVNKEGPFVAINCTALPEPLLESELFGHERGAFTGAVDRKLGKFEVAAEGTIFLDEIGSLSPGLQQKFLRVLQEREFERVGGNTPIRVGARFVAATNQDLADSVRKRVFREDLFFRLHVASVHLPPLRERREDIPLLANYFLTRYNAELKKSITGFSEEAIAILQSYAFPGNVRELENLLQRAVMLSRGQVLVPEDFRELSTGTSPGAPAAMPVISPIMRKSRAHVVALFEKQFLTDLLTRHHGNVSAAAKASRMTRQNLQRLLTKYHIRPDRFRR